MNTFTKNDKKITCPYDKSHIIQKSKMSHHLVKCIKNFPNVEYVICDFNSTHRIPKPELRYHHEICEDRRLIESRILILENEEDSSDRYPIPDTAYKEDECWDNEHYSPYNPNIYCEQNNVLRHIDVEPTSKRKNFRLNERERIHKYKGANSSKCDGNNTVGSIWNDPPVAEQNDQERLPEEKVTNQSFSEEATHLSLNDRIKKGNKKTYKPNAF